MKKNEPYGNGNGHILARIEKRMAEWATSRKYKIMNTMIQKKTVVTDVIVNIGSGHRLAMSNIKLDVEVERKKYDQRGHQELMPHK